MSTYSNTKPFKVRTKAEQAAIRRFIQTAHPTNMPKDLNTVEWVFMTNRRGKLIAGW